MVNAGGRARGVLIYSACALRRMWLRIHMADTRTTHDESLESGTGKGLVSGYRYSEATEGSNIRS